ncbi:MAG: hypothetical protein QI197_00410 [Candidatus Korarchaeota archaeon]|nr:hypothetical protein [Candidatus Korarchaeota archaeon]
MINLDILRWIVLDHHGLGYLAVIYGTLTMMSGLILLLSPRRVRRILHYVRLVHLLSGITAAIFGLLAFLIAS